MRDDHYIASDPYIMRCTECGRQMDERRETVWQAVHGWGKKRDQGGQNAVALRRPLNEFMCAGCMDKLKRGVAATQLTLGGY